MDRRLHDVLALAWSVALGAAAWIFFFSSPLLPHNTDIFASRELGEWLSLSGRECLALYYISLVLLKNIFALRAWLVTGRKKTDDAGEPDDAALSLFKNQDVIRWKIHVIVGITATNSMMFCYFYAKMCAFWIAGGIPTFAIAEVAALVVLIPLLLCAPVWIEYRARKRRNHFKLELFVEKIVRESKIAAAQRATSPSGTP